MTGYGLDLLVLWRNLFNRGQSRPQSAFLQLFGGVTLAAEAAALADRARAFSCRQLPRDRLGGVAVQQRRAQSRRCRKRLAMSFLPSTVRIQPRPHGLRAARSAGRLGKTSTTSTCRPSCDSHLLSSRQVCAEHSCSRCKRYEMLTLAKGWAPASHPLAHGLFSC